MTFATFPDFFLYPRIRRDPHDGGQDKSLRPCTRRNGDLLIHDPERKDWRSLLQKLLDLVPDPDQDEGADDLPIPLGPEGAGCAELAQQPAADNAAEKTDDDVPDETALVLVDKESGEPACDGSEEEGKNDVHGIN